MRVVSYNLLADTYIRPEWYPDIPREFLDWSSRKGRLIQHLLNLNGDILCLQEVEGHAYDDLHTVLKAQGYQGIFARKGFGRQDGCATFFRKRKLVFSGANTLFFNDQGKSDKPSGHVALMVKLAWDQQILGVVNTHIRWDRPDKPVEEHRGYVQVKELLAHLTKEEVAYWILCGDFNVNDDTPAIQRIKEAGFKDAYSDLKWPTMSKEGMARIDYIFYSPQLEAHPDLIEQLTDQSLLPSSTQPSDHLAISAVFFKT
jgi:exonuclease III